MRRAAIGSPSWRSANIVDTEQTNPLLTQRLRNTFLYLGDDMLRLSGIGEFATEWPLFGKVTPPPNYATALELIAKKGWPFQQHSLSPAEDELAVSTFEKVNAVTPNRAEPGEPSEGDRRRHRRSPVRLSECASRRAALAHDPG